MAPLAGWAAGDDVDWWERRLGTLRDHAAALVAETAKQQVELNDIRRIAADMNSLSDNMEAKAHTDIHEEMLAQEKLESEQAAMALACQQTAKLDAERRRLLEAISDANYRLAQQALASSKCAGKEAEAEEAKRTAAGRAKVLRKSLQHLGDAQANLASEEEAERVKRRQLREAVRARLHQHASERAELESRLAGRAAEMEKWEQRIKASEAAERQAIEESDLFLEQANNDANTIGPQKDREREELRRQLRETASVDDHLREELREAKERLWRKEEREREMGGRPWSAFLEKEGVPIECS